MSASLCLVAAQVAVERFAELLDFQIVRKSSEEPFGEDWVTNFADNGFTILRSNDEGWLFRNSELIANASTQGVVYSSQISERYSTCDLVCFENGRENWRVFHGLNKERKMVTELTGEAIPEFPQVMQTAFKKGNDEDHFFEVPIGIFAMRTGYQYSHMVSSERSNAFWSVTLGGK